MGDVSLADVLVRTKSGLPLPVACWAVARAAEALDAAPRAITPGEIRIGEHGEVRITPPPLSRTPFHYIAPEVIRGGDPDARSAVFGLGALLVELLTGRSPFSRESDLETRLAIAEDPAPTLSGAVADASHELDAIVQRALAKSADGRFATTGELAARIDAFLADELHDVGPDQVAAAVQAAMRGADPGEALFARGFVPPLHGAALGEPKLRVPVDAPTSDAVAPRRPTPSPGSVQPARRPTPSPGSVEPARRPTPSPGSVQPARRPTPSPGSVEPARRPTPSPGSMKPAAPSPSAASREPQRGATSFENAELDLTPQASRASHPAKPKLDRELVRLGDPLLTDEAGAGITDAALTGVDRSPPQRRGPARLDIDERALRRERERPATMLEEPEPAPGPNWVLRIAVLLVALLGAALAYQFVLRPLLH